MCPSFGAFLSAFKSLLHSLQFSQACCFYLSSLLCFLRSRCTFLFFIPCQALWREPTNAGACHQTSDECLSKSKKFFFFVSYLVDLPIGAISHQLDQLKDASRILERPKENKEGLLGWIITTSRSTVRFITYSCKRWQVGNSSTGWNISLKHK